MQYVNDCVTNYVKNERLILSTSLCSHGDNIDINIGLQATIHGHRIDH